MTFSQIKDPLDKALRTKFICSMDNEAVLKALFKLKDDKLTFLKAYQVAQEIEAARLAKETVYGKTTSKPVYKVGQPKSKVNPPRAPIPKAKDTTQGKLDQPISNVACGRCGKKTHTDSDCPHINDICRYCNKKGNLQSVWRSKRQKGTGVKCLRKLDTVKTVKRPIPQLYQLVKLRGHSQFRN